MKVDRQKLIDALVYRKLINDTPFEELDWSEFPEYKNIPKDEIEHFMATGLNNIDFYFMFTDRAKLIQ